MGSLSRLARHTSNASSVGHHIYVPFCSKTATSSASTFIDCYTPYTNSWRRATAIPGVADHLMLKDFAMVALSHYLYVIGGRLCPRAAEEGSSSGCSLNQMDCSGGEDREKVVVGCVRRYDVRNDTWKTCAPMTNPRFNFACTVSNNRIYVAGGQKISGRAEGISSTEVYDPALDQWRSLGNMKMTRYHCVGVTWKGKIYAVGGFIGGMPYIGVLARSSAEVYNEETDEWTFVRRMWDLDVPPYEIVAVNEKLFSSGDRLKPWKGHIELYDENEKIWNAVHGSHLDFLSGGGATGGRLCLTMAPIGNQLFFLARCKRSGEDSEVRSEVHVFDTAEYGEGWMRFEPADDDGEKVLCGHCCVLKPESS